MSQGQLHFLGCRELLDSVCEHCDRTSLLSLTLTCRATSDSAQDFLWNTIFSIAPLIRCMPNDLWHETVLEPSDNTNGPYHQLSFKRPILPSDWTRFKTHAARVSELMCNGMTYGRAVEYQVPASVYRALLHAAPSVPLIPSIKILKWSSDSVDMFNCAKLFFSPTLDELSLTLTEDSSYDITRFSLLGSLPLLCPSLSCLELTGCAPHSAQTDDISTYFSATVAGLQMLAHLQRLTFTLPNFPANVWHSLPSFSSLRHLTIHGNSALDVANQPPAQETTQNGFPCLEGLELKTSRPRFAMRVFKNMWQTPLKTITLEFQSETFTLGGWRTFFLKLQSGLLRCLQDISITLGSRHPSGVALTMEQLRPLLDFTELKSVRLLGIDVTLDDHDITQIAFAWPHLESLLLDGSPQSPRNATFDGLAILAQCCRALNTLRLQFDASRPLQGDYADSVMVTARSDRLTTLDVQSSPIDNPTLVAARLSALFPNLQVIQAQGDEKWTQVEESVKIFTAVRRQEIHRFITEIA